MGELTTLERKIAIVQQLGEQEGHPIPDEVARYLADATADDISRNELEGLTIRVIAYGSLTARELSIPLAVEVLGMYVRY